MKERRRNPRTQVFKPAQFIVPGCAKVNGCTVRDLSAGGACIEASAKEIPQFFELSFDWFRSFRQCEVKWRSASRIGVSFR